MKMNRLGAFAARLFLALALIVPAAQAAALGVTFQALAAVTAAAPATVAFASSAVNTSNNTVNTFTAQGIGTAAADRTVIVAASGRLTTAGATSLSCTIGGNAATVLLDGAASVNNSPVTVLCALDVPTGTTANIVITSTTTVANFGISVWAAYGLQNSTTPTATYGPDSANPGSQSENVSAGGIAISYSAINSGTNRTFTWVGLTEDVDQTVETGDLTHSGASAAFTSAQSGLSVTVTPSGAISNIRTIGVAMR